MYLCITGGLSMEGLLYLYGRQREVESRKGSEEFSMVKY